MNFRKRMLKSVLGVGGATAILGLAVPATAQLNAPLPVNTYITQSGLDWAWANPLPGSEALLTFQGQFGWRFPTAVELAMAPLASNFLFPGANVPFQGADPVSGAQFFALNDDYNSAQSAGACATPYFSSNFSHCDWQDGNGQPFGPWAGTAGADGFADQLFVRDVATGAVPEPATWAMMLLGFGFVGGAMRAAKRRHKVTVSYA